jgi:hypothetical protein
MALKFPEGLDGQIQAQSKGRPFGVCPSCNLRQIISSAVLCPECGRVTAMKVAVPKDLGAGVRDTQNPQSNPSNDHSGYSDTIPSAKFDPKRGRV